MNFVDIIDRRAQVAPDDPCLRDDRMALSNAGFAASVDAYAAALAHRGVGRGDVLAFRLSNRVELVVLLIAAWRLGAAATPVNPVLGPAETAYQVRDAGAALLVVEDAGSLETTDPSVPAVSLDELAGQAREEPPLDTIVSPAQEELALVIYTSGTTGTPKGVMLTHANLAAMTTSFIEWFELTEADHSLLVLPLFHANGIVLGTLSVLRAGGQVTITGRFARDRFFDDVERHRPTYFSAVPAIYALLSTLPAEVTPDTSSLRFAVCGAAPMPAPLIAAFEERFGVTIVEGYGLSETTTASTINPLHGVRKPGTVGLPLPLQRVAVVDEHGRPVPAGESGEVVIAGPVVMRGYLGRAEATAEAIRDGWLHTGDVGVFDEDGYLRIVDRLKDMIIRGGENVYPKEIENALYRHPAVLEAAVVGRPDPILGEVPYGFVTLRPEAVASADEILGACRVGLAAYKHPVGIEIVADIPKNPVGKIDKRSLRERFVPA